MAKVNAARQGYLTKAALPSVTRARGPLPVVNGAAIVITGNGASGDADQRRFQDRSIYNYPLYKGESTIMVNYGPFANNGGQSFNLNGYSAMALNGPSAFSFGTGDFTIECFARSRNWTLTTTIAMLFSLGTGQNHLDLRVQSSQIRAVLGTTDPAISGITLNNNQWYHIALVRSSGNTRLYVDGVQRGSTNTDSRNYICRDINSASPEPMLFSDFSYNFNNNSPNSVYGWISNMRVCNVAVYTGNFSVPTNNLQNSGAASAASYPNTTNVNTSFANTACLLLLAHGNAGDSAQLTDASGQNIGGAYTAIFNGASSPSPVFNYARGALTALSPYSDSPGSFTAGPSFDTAEIVGQSGNYKPETLNFTTECWVYLTTLTSGTVVFLDLRTGTDTNIMVQSTASQFQLVIGTTARLTSAANKLPYTWYHVAVVRIGGVIRLYVNGVSEGGTFTDTSDYNANRINFGVGANGNTNGTTARSYISDVRHVVGTGIYTGTFTPPTARLANSGVSSAGSYPSTTNINTTWALANCRALISCAYPAASIVSETAPTVYEPKPVYANNVTIDTTITKTGSGSLNFGNSATGGSSIFVPGNWQVPSSTNFTIEGWFYFNTYAGNQMLWQIGNQLSFGGSQAFRFVSLAGQLNLSTFNSQLQGNVFGNLDAGRVGQWQHIAVARVGPVVRCFIDGVQLGPDWNITSTLGNAFGLYIGNGYPGLNGGWPTLGFRGYIDDFRVVNTATIYVGNFTPPTGTVTSNVNAFTTTTNSVYGMYQNF